MPADEQQRYGLRQTVIDKINNVFAGFPEVELVILYGSRAKGTFRPGSDIDLVVEGNMTASQLLKIQTELDDLLLPYSIDLAPARDIDNQDLVDHIKRVGVVFYKRAGTVRTSD